MKRDIRCNFYVLSDSKKGLARFLESAIDMENEQYMSLEKAYIDPENADEDWVQQNQRAMTLISSKLKGASSKMLYYRFNIDRLFPLEWMSKLARLNPDLCLYMRFQDEETGEIAGCYADSDDGLSILYGKEMILDIIFNYLDEVVDNFSKELEVADSTTLSAL